MLLGPSSTTWVPVGAINRPSEVPPEVDNSVSIFKQSLILAFTAEISSPPWVIKGSPDNRHSTSNSILYFFKISSVLVGQKKF